MNYLQSLNNYDNGAMPDPLAPDHIKVTNEYGLQISRAIAQEWFAGGMLDNKNSLFTRRHEWIKEMRTYNRGEQPIDQYKKIMARQEEDMKLLNLDWNLTNYAEKFTNIVINGISDEWYRLDIRSADRFSLLESAEKYREHKKNMASKEMLKKAKEILGIDLMPKGFIPEDEEELKLYSQIKERPLQEIAEEITVNYVKSVSGWEHIKSMTDKDAVICDLMVARVETDPVNGVMVQAVDIESYGHSFVNRNDFKDAYYHFVVDTITINDLRRESNYQEAHLRKIAKLYGTFNNRTDFDTDWNSVPLENILNYRVHVMRFCFKSDKQIVMKVYLDKKNRTSKVALRDSKYQVPEGHEASRMAKGLDTWYEGNYVVGSEEYIYGYKECENLERDEMDRVMCPFVAQSSNLYRNKLKSFLSNIIPMLNKLILADFKIQHLMMELKPDLTVINLDQLAELETDVKGESKSKNWQTALSILGVKGVVIEKTINMGDEGGVQRGQSARPSPNQQGSALAPLLNIWAHYYNVIREVTGINPAMDGTISPDSLVGNNELARLAGNTNTKHIVDAAIKFDKRICENISARIKGIFSNEEAEHLKEIYRRAVGRENLEAIESQKNRHIHEFGFTVEMVPAKDELDEIRQDLGIALQEGTIDVSEKADIMRVAKYSTKQAIEYMSFLRRRRIKERMKETEFNNKLQAENNLKLQQGKIQGEVQSYQMKAEIDLQIEAQLSQIRLQEKLAMQQIEAPIKEKEFKQDVYKEQIKNMQTINLTKYKEDAKADREIKNSTRQSKMIAQRTKDLGAIDFEKEFSFDNFMD
jgi:hypothetical protein